VDLRERAKRLRESLKDLPRKLRSLPGKIRGFPKATREAILAYEAGYRKGVEKFGFWWKVFNWSMWLFILTFISTAVIAFIIYLPQSQFLRNL